MEKKNVDYVYDDFGRLVAVDFRDGASISYNYDLLANRTSVVEVAPTTPPPYAPPVVSVLPRSTCGDFENAAYVVLLSNGKLVGWGSNVTGMLANGIQSSAAAPMQEVLYDPNGPVPPSNSTVTDFGITNANLYVVFSNGWVYSSGSNDYGQLGHGDTLDRPYLKRIEYFAQKQVKIKRLWCGGTASGTNGGGCVYFQADNNSMYACGNNVAGNLGSAEAPTTNAKVPIQCAGIEFDVRYVKDVALSCGNTSFSCYMLFNDGVLKVAGYNGQGQLSRNNTTNVTGGFVSALDSSGAPFTNAVSVIANGGTSAGVGACNVIVVAGFYHYGCGYNAHGELALGDTTNRKLFESSPFTLGSVVFLGGGFNGYGVWQYDHVFGYNGHDNLFLQGSTPPLTSPAPVNVLPGIVPYFPRADQLGTNAQLFTGDLIYSGANNGQLGVQVVTWPYGLYYTQVPLSLEFNHSFNVFVHGSGVQQRCFQLTNTGELWVSGDNHNSICTGGISSDTSPTSVARYRLSFHNF